MLRLTPIRLAVLVRIIIALSTRTFFQPDEYFQSLEPAHHAVFAYGHLTWEWLTPKPIRSVAYPALNVPLYLFLKTSGLSELHVVGDWLLIYSPKLLHGILASATDIWLCEITHRWLGSRYVSTALFISLTSFFHALSLSRSFSNSLETSLTAFAFAHYPWDATSSLSPQLIYNRSHMTKTLVSSAVACIIRPTNAVIWLYLYGNLFWALRFHNSISITIFLKASIVGTITLFFLSLLDSLYYKRLTFTPLNFLLTNLSSISLFYGSSPWHYYLTQALPILCTTTLPFVLYSVWEILFNRKAIALQTMLAAVAWYVGIYSLIGHKEWRFIHPILPLLHVFAARSLVDISDISSKTKPTKSRKQKTRNRSSLFEKILNYMPPIHIKYTVFLLINIPVSLYVVLFYCSAPISVLSYIRALPGEELQKGVGFLMPCHSTPGHAYIHREELAHGEMWSLGCEPPLHQDSTTYLDQSDVFFHSPKDYLRTYFPSQVATSFPPSPFPTSIPGVPGNALTLADGSVRYPWVHEWPRYLVLFGALLRQEGVQELLEGKGYGEVWKKGREWEGEGHRKGGVRVWMWQNS